MRLPASLAIALLAAAACGEGATGTDSPLTETRLAALAASDGAGVHFLPPLGSAPAPSGDFVADAPITVRILDAAGAERRSFSAEELTVDPAGERYQVNWKSARSDVGLFRIVVSTPARDVGYLEVELTDGPPRGAAHKAGSNLPIAFHLGRAAVDADGDGAFDWEDACPFLADEQPDDADCDGAPDVAAVVRITSPGEAYGHHGSCSGWNGCGDAATCALWACLVNGYGELVGYGASGPCTAFTSCNLLDGPDRVQMEWGAHCDVMGVTDIDCAP